MILLLLLLSGCKFEGDQAKVATFPDGFLWGTASSAYQVEGNASPFTSAVDSNWSLWTEMGQVRDGQLNPRGSDFYRRYAEDIQTHLDLGLTTIRLGIGWDRVEPQNDQWEQREIDRYVDVVKLAHSRGLKVMLTFWHWVVPIWIADPRLPADDPGRDQLAVAGNEWLWNEFAEFVAKLTPQIAPYVDLYSVVNEPWSMILGGYLGGFFPPGDFFNEAGMLALQSNLIFMHARATHVIRQLDNSDADGDGITALIGVAQLASHAVPFEQNSAADQQAVAHFQYATQQVPLDAWTTGKLDVNWDGDSDDIDTIPAEGFYAELTGSLDWIGVNYYGMIPVHQNNDTALGALPFLAVGRSSSRYPLSEFYTELRAAGLVRTLRYFAQWNLPMYITENGIADCDDNQRERYIVEHLYALARTINEARLDVRGYYYWSLTDNFEWAEGFEQCFGLYGFDHKTYERLPRTSIAAYKAIVANNGVERDLLEAAIKKGYGDSANRPASLAELDAELDAELNTPQFTQRR